MYIKEKNYSLHLNWLVPNIRISYVSQQLKKLKMTTLRRSTDVIIKQKNKCLLQS